MRLLNILEYITLYYKPIELREHWYKEDDLHVFPALQVIDDNCLYVIKNVHQFKQEVDSYQGYVRHLENKNSLLEKKLEQARNQIKDFNIRIGRGYY